MKSEAQTRPSLTPNQLDLLMIVFLIGFDVAARLLMHTWNVSPVAASALFAGMMLRRRWLALLVPLAALTTSSTMATASGAPTAINSFVARCTENSGAAT